MTAAFVYNMFSVPISLSDRDQFPSTELMLSYVSFYNEIEDKN